MLELQENECSMKAHLKDQAFALFIKHNSLRSIAKSLKVSRSTIERWSRSERWMEARPQTANGVLLPPASKRAALTAHHFSVKLGRKNAEI